MWALAPKRTRRWRREKKGSTLREEEREGERERKQTLVKRKTLLADFLIREIHANLLHRVAQLFRSNVSITICIVL